MPWCWFCGRFGVCCLPSFCGFGIVSHDCFVLGEYAVNFVVILVSVDFGGLIGCELWFGCIVLGFCYLVCLGAVEVGFEV